jgi:DNA ligase 1
VRFADLAAVYERLEATPKRLEMRAILADLLRPLRGVELEEVVYLSQGILRPEYEGIELGVADSLARRAVALATGSEESEVARRTKASGDLGRTAEELLRGVRSLDEPSPLEVRGVYAELRGIASAQGEGSQEQKVRVLTELLRRASPLEARFLVRFVLGTLRVGVREMTIVDALAVAFADGSKEARAKIEGSFNLSSDLGRVATTVAAGGLEGLSAIGLEVGRPVRPMLAEREPTLAEVLARLGGEAAVEFKYDGLRVQAHLPASGPPRLFSRRLEEIGAQFPDLLEELPKAIRLRPVIVEGECVPIDPDTDEIQPFQEVARRRGRKHDLARVRQEIPVCLFLFDVLLAGSAPTYGLDFPARRARLATLVHPTDRVRLATQRVVRDEKAAAAFLDEAISAGAEGLVAKSLAPGSAYRAGARGFWWIKYKRDYTSGLTDSIDGVVVGAFHGRGRRAGRFGAFLLAVYDPARDRFPTFCKVGSGFDDAQLAEMPKRLAPLASSGPPPEVETGLTPDAWFRPGLVLEVQGAELTLSPVHRAGLGAVREAAGFALRFPRFTGRFRDDKAPADATTTQELLEMYRGQKRQEAPQGRDGDDQPT